MAETKILLREMKYLLKIGVKEEERKQHQEVSFDLDIDVAAEQESVTQDIRQTVNYSDVQREIEIFLQNKEYVLLEALANDVANLLLQKFSRIQRIQLTCWKPKALARKNVKNVGVQIVKERESQEE